MGKTGHVPTDIEEGIRDALGRKAKVVFARMVNLEVKPDKYETRIMVLTEYRMHIITSKVPAKVETSLHFLEINSLESKTAKTLVINTESKQRLVLMSEETTDDFNLAVRHLLTSLATTFPGLPQEKLISKVDFNPSSRLVDVFNKVAEIGEKLPRGPCGDFSVMYRCMCDYHNTPFMEDVAWDVDTIYLSQDSKELNLNDFDHLDNRHLLPIISALEHNRWFTRLNTSNVKLTVETVNEIIKIMKTNVTIEELILSNIAVRADFVQRLCMSLVANTGSPLTVLDLSGNAIEDKGLVHLCAPVTKLSRGLVQLNLSRTGITARGVNRLSEALLTNKNIPLNLRCLNLSENSLKGEEVTGLLNFLAQPNVITNLCLASTECALENLFAALLRGCVQTLVQLDVSGNAFSYKKQGREATTVVPIGWHQFFSSSLSLRIVNFSNCRLPPEALRIVLEGVGANSSLTDFELNLSGNGFGVAGNQGAQVLETCLSTIMNIRSLDISDNGFDVSLASVLGKLSQNKSLRKLSIGKNLNNIKPKNVPQVIEAIIQLIHQEYSPIECLNVDNLRLKADTTLLINALGSNDTLTQIDISGNQMGDIGARMLSKALQINKKLSVIYWDHNGTSPTGFQDIAAALEKNYFVRKMPTPVNDAACALRLNQDKTEQALQKIEAILQRNHNSRKLPTDQAYRLQQGFMVSSSQQEMDRLLVQLQDAIDRLEHLKQHYQMTSVRNDVQAELTNGQALLKEAEIARTFLLQLQKVVLDSDESDNVIQKQVTTLATNLHDVVTTRLQNNASDMISCAENQFPITLANRELQEEITASCSSLSRLPTDFIYNLITNHLSSDIANKTSELNFATATLISDRILDEVIATLEKTVQSLTHLLNSVRTELLLSGHLKDDDKESKQHRESLRRQKSSTSSSADEDKDVAFEMPVITDKHKSHLTRRLRPQSEVEVKIDQSDATNKNQVKSKGIDFFPTEETPLPKLEHLGKDRPRRPKTKAMTRPTAHVAQIIDDDDVSRGVSEFFDTKSNKTKEFTTERKENGVLAAHEDIDDSVRSEALGKKGKSPKSEQKGPQMGIATGIMNFFKKKSPEGEQLPPVKSTPDLPPVTSEESHPLQQRKSQEKVVEDIGNGDDAKKKDIEEQAAVQKPSSSSVSRIGLPGMSPGSLAELRAKRATAKTVYDKPENEKFYSPAAASDVPVVAAAAVSTKEARLSDGKPFLTKENNDGMTTVEDDNSFFSSGVQMRASVAVKSRPPPPLAPKPKNRMSAIISSSSSSSSPPSTSVAIIPPKPAIPISRGLSEAEESDESKAKEDEKEALPPPATIVTEKRRMSVREKAANIDKNSNLEVSSVEGNASTKKKSNTLPSDTLMTKPVSSETPLHRPASDIGVTLPASSSSSSSSTAPVVDPPPPAPSCPLPEDDDSEPGSTDQSDSDKRLSGMDDILYL